MKKILFIDTTFLINNLGKIKEVLNEIQESGYIICVTQTVKEEFINNQLRKKKKSIF